MQTLKNVVLGILNILIRVSIACLVVLYVYRFAMASYHFGYMIFTDSAKEVTPGRDITVSVELDDSVMDIGKTLEQRGVIDDAKLFFVQEYLSEYHKKILPGTYTLNTSMKPSEMLQLMATNPDKDEDEDEDENAEVVSDYEDSSDEMMSDEMSTEEDLDGAQEETEGESSESETNESEANE